MTQIFDQCFAAVVGTEGGYTADPSDPGNWTGGTRGAGECRGTKFGISAGAYPDLDIKALTLADAKAIYQRDYWQKLCCDELVPPLALIVFDAAVNSGVSRAAQWLQAAVGAAQDGIVGPDTIAAVRVAGTARSWPKVCSEVLALRLNSVARDPKWPVFGLGWSRRLAWLPWEAMGIGVP